jgi:hypothetical protein
MANDYTKIKTIHIRCEDCDHEELAAEYCPYTGMRYNTSWTTICSICKGSMKEVIDGRENDDNSDSSP